MPTSASTPPTGQPTEPSRWPLYAAFALMLAALAAIGALWWARRRTEEMVSSTILPPVEISAPAYALATLPDRKEVYPLLPGTTIVGSREDATDIMLKHPGIAEQHLAITPRNERELEVVDRAGSSGTYINNVRLVPGKPAVLEAGDLLTLGTLTLKCISWATKDQAPETTAARQNGIAAHEVGV